MESVIVSSQDDIDAHVDEFSKRGMKPAALSNTVLPQGQARLTFLPETAFETACREFQGYKEELANKRFGDDPRDFMAPPSAANKNS
jgi:hypothetical protein